MAGNPDLEARIAIVQQLIRDKIQPAVDEHAGDIDILSIDYRTDNGQPLTDIELELGGNCVGCGAKYGTLMVIKSALAEEFAKHDYHDTIRIRSGAYRV